MIRIVIVSTLVVGLVTLLAAPGQAQLGQAQPRPLRGAAAGPAVQQQGQAGILPNGLLRGSPGLSGLVAPGSLVMLNPQPLPPRYRLLRER